MNGTVRASGLAFALAGALVLALVALFALVMYAPAARAAVAADTAPDPALEARVNVLAAELRCLVCQNQSLADSHAGLAVDLKNQVRDQLRAGRTEREVIDYMTQRYGDFVLYRPPVKATTLLLWWGPWLLGLGAVGGLWLRLRRARAAPATATPEGAALERADALLRDAAKPSDAR